MRRLVLFAKRPLRGQVKTRLCPPLEPEQALALYRAFLEDQIAFLEELSAHYRVELCLDGPWDPPPSLAPRLRALPTSLQTPGDLGSRMLAAFERAYAEGARGTVIIGADAPTLPRSLVHDAFDALSAGAQAAISPADDGGYVLIGVVRPNPELFREIPWGGPEVLRLTLARAEAARVEIHRLAPWYDVDDAEDIVRLRRDLARPENLRRAPATARLLARLDSSGTPVV